MSKSTRVPLDDDECCVQLNTNRSHGWPQLPLNVALVSLGLVYILMVYMLLQGSSNVK